MKLLDQALDDLKEGETLKDRMKTVANVFLTNRQMGESEAVCKLIPSLTMTMSNVTCQFVSTGPKEERSSSGRKRQRSK